MDVIIRKYAPEDKQQVQHIHWETGLIGKSMSKVYTQKKQWAKKTKYYLEKEPESCFVAENKKTKKAIGYLFGCLSDEAMGENETKKFIKDILWHIIRYPFFNKKDQLFTRNMTSMLVQAIRGKTKEANIHPPKNSGHIHINLLPEARGKNIGSKLLKKFFTYAKKQGVKTIHADSFQTRLNPNIHFWKKNGFIEHTKATTSYWCKIYPKEHINICFYVKKL